MIVVTARLTRFLSADEWQARMALSQMNLCNKRPFPVKSFPGPTSMRNGVQL